MKATEQYFSDYYAVQCGLTFESVDEILRCDHSNRQYFC